MQEGNGKTANIILLNGQSNASGCAILDYLYKNSKNKEIEKYKNGYSNVFINYFNENGNTSSNGEFVKVKGGQGANLNMFGPELGIADYLAKNYPNEIFFIIKYAWSGSCLYSQWIQPNGEGGDLYDAFINFTKTSLNYLILKNYSININGMCWMQGESDSMIYELAQDYQINTLNLINNVRNDLKNFNSSKGIYFIDAGIGNGELLKYYQIVNNAKYDVSLLDAKNIYIDTLKDGLRCDEEPYDNPDIYHYDSLSMIKLGNLFAQQVLKTL